MSSLKSKSATVSDDIKEFICNNCGIRVVKLFCIMMFNLLSGNARVYTFLDSSKCLDAFLVWKNIHDVYVDTFTREIYVTRNHPLYSFGVPLTKDLIK